VGYELFRLLNFFFIFSWFFTFVSQIRLAQVLMLIPQPFALDYDELDAAISSKFSNDPFALLPSCALDNMTKSKLTLFSYLATLSACTSTRSRSAHTTTALKCSNCV